MIAVSVVTRALISARFESIGKRGYLLDSEIPDNFSPFLQEDFIVECFEFIPYKVREYKIQTLLG